MADFAHWDIIMFFIAQSIIIIGAIVAAYVRTQVAIAQLSVQIIATHSELEGKIDSVESMTQSLKSDHSNLGEQVGGISRSLAFLSGQVSVIHPQPGNNQTPEGGP